MYRDPFGAGIEAGDPAHPVDQRRPVVGSGAPDEGAVDIEQNQRAMYHGLNVLRSLMRYGD